MSAPAIPDIGGLGPLLESRSPAHVSRPVGSGSQRRYRVSTMVENTRKPRKIESVEERADRLENEKQQRRDEDAAQDARVDAMVKRNIETEGP